MNVADGDFDKKSQSAHESLLVHQEDGSHYPTCLSKSCTKAG
jgi:hypothetical protein